MTALDLEGLKLFLKYLIYEIVEGDLPFQRVSTVADDFLERCGQAHHRSSFLNIFYPQAWQLRLREAPAIESSRLI